jgi:hypothetical protein
MEVGDTRNDCQREEGSDERIATQNIVFQLEI